MNLDQQQDLDEARHDIGLAAIGIERRLIRLAVNFPDLGLMAAELKEWRDRTDALFLLLRKVEKAPAEPLSDAERETIIAGAKEEYLANGMVKACKLLRRSLDIPLGEAYAIARPWMAEAKP